MAVLMLAARSLRNRAFTSALTVASVALSVALLIGVERLRHQAQASFASTLSGTDLIVGARSSPLQLLLYSVFRIGDPTNNIRWESYRAVASHPQVAWSVPVVLGDSHRGYRVLGTTRGYLEHFRYGTNRSLTLARGAWFADEHDVVLGAEVARTLGYGLGDPVVVAHGGGDIAFVEHADKPFRVSGILEVTGTPVDRTLHVSLRAIDRLHADMDDASHSHGGDPIFGRVRALREGAARARVESAGGRESGHERRRAADTEAHEAGHAHDHEARGAGHEDTHHGRHGAAAPRVGSPSSADSTRESTPAARPTAHAEQPVAAVSAVLVGLSSRGAAVFVQRELNEYFGEPLTAILPGVTIQELWGIVGVLERTLLAVSGFVVVVGLSGMLVALMARLEERRREMAVLRSVGARPVHVLGLIVGEATFLTAVAAGLGLALVHALVALGQPLLRSELGLHVEPGWPESTEWVLLGLVIAVGVLVGLVPGLRIYRQSLADGMTIRT